MSQCCILQVYRALSNVIAIKLFHLETVKLPVEIEVAIYLIYSAMFIVLAVFASKGYLPGAKRKKIEKFLVQDNTAKEEWF
jgi:hypothetical protein